MKHVTFKSIEQMWDHIDCLYYREIACDNDGSEKAGYPIYELPNREGRLSDLGNRVEVTYYDGREPVTFWAESEEAPVIYVVPHDAENEHDIWADFACRYDPDIIDVEGVFSTYEEAVNYLDILKSREPAEANWGSVYIESETQKRSLVNTLKKFGIKCYTGSYGEGYHVSILTMGETDIQLVNLILDNI